MKDSNIVIDSLIGFAIGDALGVPVEFCEREYVKSLNLNSMITGTHNVKKGSWSDDTSMIIATIDSIIKNNGIIDYQNIMDSYIKMVDTGEYTALGYAFDVGNTITKSLNKYKNISNPFSGCDDYMDNGNGSLMRILPISLYCIVNNLSLEETRNIINKSSSLTHAHDISKLGCYIYTIFLKNIIETKNVLEAFENILNIDYSSYDKEAVNAYNRLLNKDFININEDEINSTGYVVYTLESIIYSLINSNNYKDAVLTSINLGFDTDTIGALTGSVAGILYGYNNIPTVWLEDLVKIDYLKDYSNKYYDILLSRNGELNE